MISVVIVKLKLLQTIFTNQTPCRGKKDNCHIRIKYQHDFLVVWLNIRQKSSYGRALLLLFCLVSMHCIGKNYIRERVLVIGAKLSLSQSVLSNQTFRVL